MRTIKITKKGIYADPNPALPHLVVSEDDVVEVGDALADRMCGEYHAAEMTEAEPDEPAEEIDPLEVAVASGWKGEVIKVFVEKYSRKVLAAACAENELDTKGNKETLAGRLVDKGITEI